MARWGGKKRLGRDFEVETQEQSSVEMGGMRVSPVVGAQGNKL